MIHTTQPVAAAAGQARAQRITDGAGADARQRCPGDTDDQRRMSLAYEVGILRGWVGNLCAEVAAFEPEDGSVEVEFNGERLWVHIPSELIQTNGFDLSRLLSADDKASILTIAEGVQRQQWIDAGAEERFRAREAA